MPVNPGMLAEVFYSTLSFPLSSIVDSFESPVSTAILLYRLPRSTRQLDLHWGDHCLSPLLHRQRKVITFQNRLKLSTCPGCLIRLEILSEGAAILDDEWLCWDTDTEQLHIVSFSSLLKRPLGKAFFSAHHRTAYSPPRSKYNERVSRLSAEQRLNCSHSQFFTHPYEIGVWTSDTHIDTQISIHRCTYICIHIPLPLLPTPHPLPPKFTDLNERALAWARKFLEP